jgi:hypothetical protein
MTSATPTLCRKQEVRAAYARPAIPWHMHPAWSIWAQMRPEFPHVTPPRPLTAQELHDLIVGKS